METQTTLNTTCRHRGTETKTGTRTGVLELELEQGDWSVRAKYIQIERVRCDI